MAEARFMLEKMRSGTLMVKDTKSNTIVCTFNNAGRPFEHTYKMAEIMAAALNKVILGEKKEHGRTA